MKTQKLTVAALFLALGMILSVSLMAQNGQGKGNRNANCDGQGKFYHGQNYKGNFIESLDLSDEQQAKLEKMRTAHMETMLPMQNKMQELQAKRNTLSTDKNADIKAINAVIDEIGALKTEMMKTREAHQQEVRSILTDDQRIKFDMHRSHHKNKGGGFGKGCGHGQGKGYGKNFQN